MRFKDFITEQPVTTSNLKTRGTTTVNKAANRVTQQSDAGTTVKDRTGGVRSIQTPKIGGFQAKQTFRPDATPGYQQATYQQGPTTLDIKGSPETGFTKSASFSAGGANVKQTQRYSGQKQTDASLKMGNGKTFKATLTQSQVEDVQAAIREHIKQKVPFTECMFRPGSEAFTLFYRTVKEIREHLDLDWQDEELLDTDIGECIMVEGELVPLDVPMEDTNDWDDEVDMYSSSDAEAENSVEYGIVRYPDTSISYVRNAFGQGWMHIYDASYGYEGPLDKADMKYLSLIDADQVPSRLRENEQKVIGIDPSDIAQMDDKEIEQLKALMQRAAKLDNLERGNDGTYHPGMADVVKRAGKPSKTKTPMVGLGILKKNEDLEEAQLDEKSCGEKGVKPNSPKRGGSKKFYVYVNTPSGNCKKISWGDTTGLSVKAKDRGAVRSFVARHKCKQANDRTTARYWSCRTPRYKSLGVKGGQWW